MNKVIVTGATGFIGRQTIPFLKKNGYEIHAVTSKNNSEGLNNDACWHSVDLFDYENVARFCKEIEAESLLHLAWHDIPNERMDSPANLQWVESSINLVREFVANEGQQIVMAGSCAEYDWQYGYCNEDVTPLKPNSLYGACKLSLHKIIKKYALKMGVQYCNGRIFFVYGPHESKHRLVAYVINTLLKNREATIKHGSLIRDYLYVKDVAHVLVKLLRSDLEGSVNIASGEPNTLGEIVKEVGRMLNKSELISIRSPQEVAEPHPLVLADVSKLREELDWKPRYELELGLEETVEWWKDRMKVTLNN